MEASPLWQIVARQVSQKWDQNQQGLIVNSSRSIIFNSQPQQAAKKLQQQINNLRLS